jgi:hypothetical protein
LTYGGNAARQSFSTSARREVRGLTSTGSGSAACQMVGSSARVTRPPSDRLTGLDGSDVFIETKVWISDYGYDETLHAFDDKSAAKKR